MNEAYNRRRATYQVLLATLWLTLLVLAVKVWAGWATRSLSLLADSLHTLIDSFSIILSLIAATSPYRISSRHVWSHRQQEAVTALLLSSFLGFSGLSLLLVAVQQLGAIVQNGEPLFAVQMSLPLIQFLGVVIAINVCLILFERYESRVLENLILRINANHMLCDVWLTLVMWLGFVGVSAGYAWIDAVMAIVLVCFCCVSVWRVLTWQMPLMVKPMAIAPEVLAQIACQIEGVTHCYDISAKGVVGRQVFVAMRLVLHPEFMMASRLIAERVEGAIRERYGPVQAIVLVDDEAMGVKASLKAVEFYKLRPKGKRGHPDWN